MKRRPFKLLAALHRDAHENRLTGLAAEVTFFAVLSLFPGLLIVASTLGYLQSILGHDVAQRSQETAINFLTLVLTERGSLVIQSVRELFVRDSSGVATIASVVAFYTLSTGFASLIRALDQVYGVAEKRSWLHVWLTTLYHLAPYRRRDEGWMKELPGAMLASLFLFTVSLGFGFYLSLATAGNQVLGVLGGGLILMVWLYVMTLALLIGGELNAIIARDRG